MLIPIEMARAGNAPITPRILGKDISVVNILGGPIAIPQPIPVIALPVKKENSIREHSNWQDARVLLSY